MHTLHLQAAVGAWRRAFTRHVPVHTCAAHAHPYRSKRARRLRACSASPPPPTGGTPSHPSGLPTHWWHPTTPVRRTRNPSAHTVGKRQALGERSAHALACRLDLDNMENAQLAGCPAREQSRRAAGPTARRKVKMRRRLPQPCTTQQQRSGSGHPAERGRERHANGSGSGGSSAACARPTRPADARHTPRSPPSLTARTTGGGGQTWAAGGRQATARPPRRPPTPAAPAPRDPERRAAATAPAASAPMA